MTSLPLYVLKSHESFTYVSPDVFSVLHKIFIINVLQDIVRVSFSAPSASQQCGAFLFVNRLVCPARLMYKFGVQARLVHHGIDPVGQIYLEDPGIALIPMVDQFEVVG